MTVEELLSLAAGLQQFPHEWDSADSVLSSAGEDELDEDELELASAAGPDFRTFLKLHND